jgi:SAM-dependent methyltransferase
VPGFVPAPADVPSTRAVANSYNYVRRGAARPAAATPAECPGAAMTGRDDPDRCVLLEREGELALYHCDTRDFDAAAIRRVKRDYSHLYFDRSATAALDDFVDSIRRVAPDPFCDPCAERDRCGRRALVREGRAFTRDERWIANWVGRLRGRVLDVGCGEQLYRDRLAPLVEQGLIEYHGLDPDTVALGELARHIPGGRYTLGGIETYQHRPGYFDHLLCLRSLNHITDLRVAFERMVGLLRPQGTLLIAECTPFALLREARQVAFADRQPRAGHQHLRNWDSWEVLGQLRLHPLRTMYHRPVTAGSNNQWLLHLLRTGDGSRERA